MEDPQGTCLRSHSHIGNRCPTSGFLEIMWCRSGRSMIHIHIYIEREREILLASLSIYMYIHVSSKFKEPSNASDLHVLGHVAHNSADTSMRARLRLLCFIV